MTRRAFAYACIGGPLLRPDDRKISIRGTLASGPDDKPALRMSGGNAVMPSGDEPTEGVLRDKRVIGTEVEFIGHYTAPDRFRIDPIHTKAIFSWKNGRRQYITYWCEVCSIRTYTPGACWCCQQDTALDIRDNYEQ